MAEDALGEAFVGPSGALLNLMLHDAGVKRTDVFTVNCVLCRPCDTIAGDNREPRADEVLACSENVRTICQCVRPGVPVVLLGDIADRYFRNEYPSALKLVHPAALARKGGQRAPYYPMAVRVLRDYLQLIDIRGRV